MQQGGGSGAQEETAKGMASQLNASPFEPKQAATESKFDSAAKPFRIQEDGGMKPSLSSASLSSKTVNAAPFVPGGGGGRGGGGGGGGASTATSKAGSGNFFLSTSSAPFVPGSLPMSVPANVNANAAPFLPTAAPFMPKGGGSAQRANSAMAPGVPAPPRPSQGFQAPQGKLTTHSAAAIGLLGGHQLPDGDDLLGMTAVTHASPQVVAALADPNSAQAQALLAQMASISVQEPQQAYGKAQYRSPLQGKPMGTAGGRGGIPGQDTAAYSQAMGRGRGRDVRTGYGGRGNGRGRGGMNQGGRGMGQNQTSAGRGTLKSRFVSERLRAELQQRAHLVQAQLNPETDGDMGLPEKIHHYHSIYPLEDLILAEERPSMTLGVRTLVLKGISAIDGQAYALRWIDGRQVILTPELLNAAHESVEKWSAVASHPHVICPKQAVATKEMENAASLVFAYDYHPGAVTIEAIHMQPTQTKSGLVRNACTEDQLWSYLVQIASALRAMHTFGLVARQGTLMPSKILLTSAGRLRIGGLGLMDLVAENSAADQHRMQREDLTATGRLMLTLACAGGNSTPSLEYCAQYFSADFVTLVRHLLGSAEGGTLANGKQLVAVLGERVMIEMETAHLQNDALISELTKECENGRLLRLLVKLGCINERPDGDMDVQWSETGDRYLLKLFRDFVFHQTSEDGAPVLDWGHMLEALNKLDSGVHEKILLLSRDEMSMLVSSYSDIKRCTEGAYNELKTRATQARIMKSQKQREQQQQQNYRHNMHLDMDPSLY